MCDIKIFVSMRIDTESQIVPNPLYVPVYCGAVYGSGKLSILHDDVGENISGKRNQLGELTVAYWAWKNETAQYYGLCHYRRYLSFSKKRFRENVHAEVMEPFLDSKAMEKYGLLDAASMRGCIKTYDALLNQPADVRAIPLPTLQRVQNVYEHWAAHDGVFFDARVLPMLKEAIRQGAPEYAAWADRYFHQEWHRGFNCYVMRKDLFQSLCDFQFRVLSHLEPQIRERNLIGAYPRTLGYMGEILYGVYTYYLTVSGKYHVKECQLIHFEQTELPASLWKRCWERCMFFLKFRLENIGFRFFPKGSERRHIARNLYFALTDKIK